jgi:leucyl/phenylalanyl-tRNA--protein transferase
MWLPASAPAQAFPDVDRALDEPNGLLALGGNLAPERLLHAYAHGIFPWFSEGQPILWWSPDPRMVLFPGDLRVSRSLRRRLRRGEYQVSVDRCFRRVVKSCAAPRADASGTWILPEMIEAYDRLHRLGHAHSVECWQGERLAGGLYGVALGRVFFGESMFSALPDASKVALAHLCELDLALIDCQLPSAHLERLGARAIPRREFCDRVARAVIETAPDFRRATPGEAPPRDPAETRR